MQDVLSLPIGYYVAVIAVVASIVWILRKTGDPNGRDAFGQLIKRPERTRRDELIEARDRVRRQIEILESPARQSDNTWQNREALKRLREVLGGIESELADATPR
jgi:hypothetical protein